MKFKADYKRLVEANSYAKTATSSRTVTDDTRNIIFIADETGVQLATYTVPSQIRVSLDATEVEVEGVEYFQIKASRLNAILAPYSNMALTYVNEVTFETFDNKVVITVHEEPVDEDRVEYARDNTYHLAVSSVSDANFRAVSKKFGEDGEMFTSQVLGLIFKDMIAHMTNDTSASLEAHINIAEEFVYVNSKRYISGYQNRLPSVMNGIALDYAQVSTILLMADAAEAVINELDDDELEDYEVDGLTQIPLKVAQIDGTTIGFQIEGVEYFVNPRKSRQVRYSDSYDPMFKADDTGTIPGRAVGVQLNRIYAKDVLSRLESDKDDTPVFTMTEDGMVATNKVFEGVIPFEDTVGSIEGIAFKIDPTFLKKLVIGDDALYGEVGLWFYFSSSNSKAIVLNVMDESNRWLTSTQVRAA